MTKKQLSGTRSSRRRDSCSETHHRLMAVYRNASLIVTQPTLSSDAKCSRFMASMHAYETDRVTVSSRCKLAESDVELPLQYGVQQGARVRNAFQTNAFTFAHPQIHRAILETTALLAQHSRRQSTTRGRWMTSGHWSCIGQCRWEQRGHVYMCIPA